MPSSVYSPVKFGVFGNSQDLNVRFLNSASEKLEGKNFEWYPGWLYFAARRLNSTIYVYAYPIGKIDNEPLSYNVEKAIIVDDETKEDTSEKLTVESWKRLIRLKAGRPISFIVVKDCEGKKKVSPGDVTQDGVVEMSILKGINVTLPFKL